VKYPLSGFSYSENEFKVRVGKSNFSEKGMELYIDSPDLKIEGELFINKNEIGFPEEPGTLKKTGAHRSPNRRFGCTATLLKNPEVRLRFRWQKFRGWGVSLSATFAFCLPKENFTFLRLTTAQKLQNSTFNLRFWKLN